MTKSKIALGNSYLEAEADREQAIEQRKAYDAAQSASQGGVAHYASGTTSSVGGLIVKDEQGYEALFKPANGGDYQYVDEGSQIFTAQDTAKLRDLARNGVSQQSIHLASNMNSNNIQPVQTHDVSQSTTNQIDVHEVSFPNAKDKEEIMQAFGELPTYFKQKTYSK